MGFRIIRAENKEYCDVQVFGGEPEVSVQRLSEYYRARLSGGGTVSMELAAADGLSREEAMRVALDEIFSAQADSNIDVTLLVPQTRKRFFNMRDALRTYSNEELNATLRSFDSDIHDVKLEPPVGRPRDELHGAVNIPQPLKPGRVPLSDSAKELMPALLKAERKPRKLFGGLRQSKMMEASAAAPEELPITRELKERMKHLSDTFSEYLMFLIELKGLTPADVYKKAIVDKKVFSKIKNDKEYHPQKITAMCLCVGAGLSLDEAKDLLARAGYAFSPSSVTDQVFTYFLENGIYDMIELDIQLEEMGEPCIIQ